MEIYLKNWYDKLLSELPKTKTLKIISPFVKEQVVRKIQDHFDFAYFELITRFNLRDFASNVSDLEGLRFSVENGAKVYGVKDLHSKVYIFDSRAAIITSANLTNGGLTNNHECGILLNDEKIVKQILQHFDELKNISNSNLSIGQCDLWQHQLSQIVVENSQIPSFPDYGGSSEHQINQEINYYVKFLGTSQNRQSLRFSVRDEIDRALCHYACGFSKNKKPRKIQTGDIIYMARMTHSPNNYSIFGKAEAIKFVDGRDEASKNEIKERPWKTDWPIYLRVTNPIFIDGTLGDGVLLYDLIKSLDYESFPSTKLKYNEGRRDINAYKSLSQQPYVQLTTKAVEWLEPRFQSALNRMNPVDKNYLNSLPKSNFP